MGFRTHSPASFLVYKAIVPACISARIFVKKLLQTAVARHNLLPHDPFASKRLVKP